MENENETPKPDPLEDLIAETPTPAAAVKQARQEVAEEQAQEDVRRVKRELATQDVETKRLVQRVRDSRAAAKRDHAPPNAQTDAQALYAADTVSDAYNAARNDAENGWYMQV